MGGTPTNIETYLETKERVNRAAVRAAARDARRTKHHAVYLGPNPEQRIVYPIT